jgi:hypothetical protein
MPDADSTMERLEDQIGWYDRKSNSNQRTFERMKAPRLASQAPIARPPSAAAADRWPEAL